MLKEEGFANFIPPLSVSFLILNQCIKGRKFTHFDLVVVSPLTRTLQTAKYIFGPGRQPGTYVKVMQLTYTHIIDLKSYIFDTTTGVPAFISERFEETDLPCPRILVMEECRERWGEYSCDGRRSLSEIMPSFPDFDFSKIEVRYRVMHNICNL